MEPADYGRLVRDCVPALRAAQPGSVVIGAGLSSGRVPWLEGAGPDALALLDGIAVHPYGLRAPFVKLLDVLQYQIVHRPAGLDVRVVVRPAAGYDVATTVRAKLEDAVRAAGAACPVAVDVVDEIAREPGPAAKVKLVRSEVASSGS